MADHSTIPVITFTYMPACSREAATEALEKLRTIIDRGSGVVSQSVYFTPSADLSDNAPDVHAADSMPCAGTNRSFSGLMYGLPAFGAPVHVAAAPSRDDVRWQIDRLLAANRAPFATARRAAVMAGAEVLPSMGLSEARDVLDAVDVYERLRGGTRKPSFAAEDYKATWCKGGRRLVVIGLDAYERARGLP